MVGRRLSRATRRAAGAAGWTVTEPARCPAGWRTGPPDFVGVGAPRSGTSWWHGLIVDHPGIEPVAIRRRLRASRRAEPGRSIPAWRAALVEKELHFFNSFCEREMSPEDVALYHRFFPRPDGSIAGEWTPGYMFDFWTPPLLAAAAPQAKLLVLLRDPIERLRSGLAAGAGERRRIRLARTQWSNAFHRSRYLPQLLRLLRHFDGDRLLLLQYERCLEDPAGQLRRTYEFLDVEPTDHLPAGIGERHDVSAKRPLREDLRRTLVSELRDDVRRVAERFPEVDVDLWPNFEGLRPA